MLSKLLKKDLKRNMRWFWILFASTILIALMSRCCKMLGQNIVFFKILGIIFDSVFYSLAVNVILQPFLRNFLNFAKSFYSDESYLTHTLPVTKNQLINSKYLTAIIEITSGFACLILSILIMFASPTMDDVLKILISTMIKGEFSLIIVLAIFIILVVVEFLMFISIIFFSIVLAYKSREKRVLKTFLYTMAFAFASLAVLSIVMLIVLSVNGVKIVTSSLVLSYSAAISVVVAGILVYTLVTILFYFLTKREFNKGVNVD